MSISLETVIMELVVNAGSARSLAMEAIRIAKSGDILGARAKITEADDALEKAHEFQTELIQSESRGDKPEINLLMVHAQDQLMNAMTIRDMSREFIAIYEKIN